MTIKILASTLAIGLSLSGCIGGGGATSNRSLNSVHQPVVRQSNYVFDADASSGLLPPAEVRRVSDWLDAMNVGYGDRIAIDDGGAYNSRPAQDAVAMLLARKGMLLADHAPITGGAIAPGRIRIVITRATATVPGCPNWDTRSNTNFASSTTSNYGCATNANLAAMVADANDLVHGQGRSGNDVLTASKAIEAYRAAPPTGAEGLGGGEGGAASAAAGGGQ
ncbi:MAG: CpaD family pilus assembly protein [Sphingopyxis sp.]